MPMNRSLPSLARQLGNPLLGRLAAAALCLGSLGLRAAETTPAVGQPPAAGREPASQGEGDWVDNRWARTDKGQFLASNLEIPGARIAKGLSIKVGQNDEGAVCFDTGLCAIRAGWLGGFLRVDPSRFGLIQPPRIEGATQFTAPTAAGWVDATTHYTGLHLNGKRVVLEYEVDGKKTLDSPWLEVLNGAKLFTRSLKLPPSKGPMKLAVAVGGRNLSVQSDEDGTRVVTETDKGVLAASLFGENAAWSIQNGNLCLTFPPHDQPLSVKILLWSGERADLPKFHAAIKAGGAVEDLEALAKPGPAHWLPELTTVGQRGLDTDILAVDTLTVPYDNPWKALMFFAGVDFTPDGAAYVCSIHGDVWKVTGIDDKLGQLHWKRFATGLFQALGLKVRDGEVFVLGRDQITRLRDLNGDGEADSYENFCNLVQTSTGGHDYVTSLEKDNAGNFYYVDPRGVHRVSSSGKTMETIATGFRNPNGMGVRPDGKLITAAPQQGDWTPSSQISEIKQGGFYGYGGPRVTPERPLGYDAPLCWIPHSIDNSSGSQVWIPENQWGALGGHFLHLLWGRCGMMLVARDQVDGISQGAVIPLPGRLLSGPNRGSFNARDGHLYVAGSTGWQTSSLKDGMLQRVRFTGKPVYLPTGWHAHANGITLTFAEPLDRAAAEDAGSYSVHQWNYRYAGQYGSKDWSVANPDTEGRDEVQVKSARLLPDGKSVFIEMEPLKPVMQMEIKCNLNSASGKTMRNQFWLTLNKLDTARP